MTREQIREAVRRNLREAGMDVAELRIQPDEYGGWRMALVSEGFRGRSTATRKQIALKGLEEVDFEWLDLLTLEEREWAGTLPTDSALETLPLWPEALARGGGPLEQPVFPSDLDEDLPPPIVATYYSLRGGVGRSSALAYAARVLASRGRKVVCIDMDVEAPGLAALFGREAEVAAGQGTVELLIRIDQGEEPDVSQHLLPLSTADDLYLLPAGRPDADYARRLRLIDPVAWYREERNPLRLLLKGVECGLSFTPDVVLLDARTGITPLSGPLLFDLADLAVIVFFPHPQARTGTGALVRGLLAARTRRSTPDRALAPEPRFIVSPIPAIKGPEVAKRYEHRPVEWIAEWLRPVNDARTGKDHDSLIEDDVTHFIRYRQDLATADVILPDAEVWRLFEPVADWVDRFLPTAAEQRGVATIKDAKAAILDELKFAPGTAEEQHDFLESFVETEIVRKAMDSTIPLVLGRKGAGKTAVFRRLSEAAETSAIVVQAPSALRGPRNWMLRIAGFEEVERELAASGADWRQFWTFYVCFAVARSLAWGDSIPVDLRPALTPPPESELQLLSAFEKVVRLRRYGLLLDEWLSRLDRAGRPDTLLLLDGLDTGFGNDEPARARRNESLEGLFTFWTDLAPSLRNLRFKIVLREDIWRKLRFQNKSHLFGRAVALKWSEQASFFKVVLKQAVHSDPFRRLLEATPGVGTGAGAVDTWSEDQVITVLSLLVGERMKGGKTTFTRNWIWNRLADGNEDHTPRYLLQLFHEVVPWERTQHARSAYERSIIRPRGLIAALPQVSEQALGALGEEFVELEELLVRLRRIGRTPLPAASEELTGIEDAIALAREVGLLTIYEGTEETVERYKVPDIYRWGLQMTRRGQA